MAALELDGVVARYGGRTVLDGVDLEVPEGDKLALIGPNGSGKTTLLRALAGILRPERGSVRPAGSLARHAIARALAYLPQEELWEFPFTVEQLVSCGRYAHAPGLFGESAEDRAAIDEALDAVGMADLASRPVTELSGGERRRAVLARALAQRAPALLLDEPTTALDLEHRHSVLAVLARRTGTLVLATHDLDAAAATCHRVVALSKGRIVADGAPADVLCEELLADVFRVRVRVLRQEGRIHVVPEI